MTLPSRPAVRYHGLDGLRGFAMLVGIVLHASLPYWSRIAKIESMWPADDRQSSLLWVVFEFIHVWRMPTFFLLAGFFAHLVLERQSMSKFLIDRFGRIALPLVIFGAVMVVIIPPIWEYGWTGEFSIQVFTNALKAPPDLGSSGGLLAHLWFLYYLLLLYTALLLFRVLTNLLPIARLVGRIAVNILYTRIPIVLILGAIVLLVLRAGDEAKLIWPLNMTDLLYTGLYFFYGYGLYGRRDLIEGFKSRPVVAILLVIAGLSFLCHLWFAVAATEVAKEGNVILAEQLGIVNLLFYGVTAVCFSVGFIGLFERLMQSPGPRVRWLADSSYWIYILHLPVVTLLTFYLAHLDRQGWLKYLTGFTWSAELKFLVACLLTGALGIATYRYLVRYTPVGTLLNGNRIGT